MKVLIVDDEEVNVEILEDILSEEGFESLSASNGSEALDILKESPDVQIILLDRMMPVMDGMEFISKVKENESLKDIPVVMQTAATQPNEVVEGINAGVFYYLTKPYKKPLLTSILRSAADDYMRIQQLNSEIESNQSSFGMVKDAVFEYKTVEEAEKLASTLAFSYPRPASAILGLNELLVNAVEHGNLEIDFVLKGELLKSGSLYEERQLRQDNENYKNRTATAHFKRENDKVTLNIKDQGSGFNWKEFERFDADRASAPNGRGIMMAKMTSFDEVNYIGCGNEVECVVYLNK